MISTAVLSPCGLYRYHLTRAWNDAALCPGPRERWTNTVWCEDQHEGLAALHHKDGWTALAWWDRSVDKRHNSNSVLIAEGTFTADEMLDMGRRHFPTVMGRFTYDIRVVA